MPEQYTEISSSLIGEWIVVANVADLDMQQRLTTYLDGRALFIEWLDQTLQVRWQHDHSKLPVQIQQAYGFIWVCVGTAKKVLFELDEYAVTDARRVPCGAFSVRTSPLRAIENFLDMAHFPYIHTDILGAEPATVVKPYRVELRHACDEIWATECFFTQPLAAPSSSEPQETEYVYRVASPLNAILYKVNTLATGIIPADVICLFIQPISETLIRAHLLMILDDQTSTLDEMIRFQHTIFTQDKPILENHMPLALPLYQRMEIPTKADALASAYRQWLIEKNWQYGVYRPKESGLT